MNTKTLLAGLVGGVAAFFLGWLIYGKVLMPIMAEHCNSSVMRAEADMIWWAMIVSNLFWGLSMALLLSWGNVTNFMTGMTRGAIFGFVLLVGIDLSYYSMTTMYTDTTGVVIDVLAGTVMNALIGGVVGWMLGRGNATAAA